MQHTECDCVIAYQRHARRELGIVCLAAICWALLPICVLGFAYAAYLAV